MNRFKSTLHLSLLTMLPVFMGTPSETRACWLPPASASMSIFNPLTGDGLMPLFSTHRPMEERLARLEPLATRTQ